MEILLGVAAPVAALVFTIVAVALDKPTKNRRKIIVTIGIITTIVAGVNSWGIHARSEAATAERRAIRVDLAALANEGMALARRCTNESEPPPTEEANQWARRTEDFLRTRLDDSYVARFRSHSGLPPMTTSIQSAPHRNLSVKLRVRLARLNQFLEKLAE